MCGLFGHVGASESIKKCLKGLRFLEYRGYDSAGIAGIENGLLCCFKEKGKISELEKLLESKLENFQASIGHTRWATHGRVSRENAHPHLDHKKEVAVVHNGILENHRALRLMLESKGITFESETDTEVIAQLISYFYDNDIVAAVRKATSLMKGFWGLAIIHKNHPDHIIATCLENSIVVGMSKQTNEAFLASDPYAFTEKQVDLYYLQNGDIALISANHLEIYDQDAHKVARLPEQIELSAFEASKGEFEHFMLKEIFEQPAAIRSTLHNRIDLENGSAIFETLKLSREDFQAIKRVLFIGCGSSWHAGLIGSLQLEALAGIPASSEIASEYRYRETPLDSETLIIALSQSGETFDTIAAIRKAKRLGAMVIAICNVPNSTLMREAHHRILLRAGPEVSVCATKTFTSLLTVLSLLNLYLARLKSMTQQEGREFLKSLINVPYLAESILERKGEIETIAKKYVFKPRFFFLGRQYMFPTCLEAALKLKEISYLNATAYPSGELKHGPIALVDPDCLVIGLCGNKTTLEKMLSNCAEVKSREGEILSLAPEGTEGVEEISDQVLWLPPCPDPLAPILYSIPLQLFAYAIAKQRGNSIDQPRNLAKSVTVE